MKHWLSVLSLLLSIPAQADVLILFTGTSSPAASHFLGETANQSALHGLRWEGEHYGLRLDHSIGGDDAGNSYITGDSIWRPSSWLVLGAGIMADTQPLRGTGSRMNFHAMLGTENPKLFGHFGAGLWFDHWSNGHIHYLFGPDAVPNPPRNVLSIGIVLPWR